MGEKLLVSTDWLVTHLSEPSLVLLDASWYMPTDQRDPEAEFQARHIPGAQFFDIDDIADKATDLPHMVPSEAEFAAAMSVRGIRNTDQVVIYDTAGLLSAPRVWWTFRLFGHERVAILDGGMPKWEREGRPLTANLTNRPTSSFNATLNPDLLADMNVIAQASKSGTAQIADGRGAPRFRGEAPEPRSGLAKGRIPGSINVFFADLITSDGTLKDAAAIKNLFEDAGIDLSRPVITSCGSGITAAVLSLGLAIIGHRDHALYDGSFAEWGQPGMGAIETG